MTRNDLVREVARRHGLTQRVSLSVVRDVLDGIEDALVSGKRVEIRGFGTFRPRIYPPYEGRNPRTGERVRVDYKVLPVFRTGKVLSGRIEQVAFEEE